jgi:hypothetical protein
MSKRRRSGTSKKVAEAKFWGEKEARAAEQAEPRRVRPTPDASVLVRSLGPPPLAVDEREATVHLASIYGEAVRTATALLAANGLLADLDEG